MNTQSVDAAPSSDIFSSTFLLGNVGLDIFQVRRADAESGVPGLPTEATTLGPSLVHPFRGIGFDFFHAIGEGDGLRQDEK